MNGTNIATSAISTYCNMSAGSVGFNSNLPLDDKVAVTMYVYADVLDANHNILNYSTQSSKDGQTYLQAINNASLPGQDNDISQNPFVNVGIQNAALSFSQTSNGSTAIPGFITANPNSAGFTFRT